MVSLSRSYSDVVERGKDHKERGGVMGDVNVDDNDAILKSFLAEVGEVERDNEVVRFLFLCPPP